MINHKHKKIICNSVLALAFLFSTACSKMRAIQSSRAFSSTQCKVSKASPANLSEEYPANKIAIDDFLKNTGTVGVSKVQSFHLNKSQEIVLTINRLCLRDRIDSSLFPLTKDMKPYSAGSRTSVSESHSFTLPEDMSLNTLEGLAKADSCVEMISPNVMVGKSSLPNDTFLAKQTHLAAIHYNTSFDFYFTANQSINSDTIIAVIDDGVDITHPDLKNLIWVNTAEKNGRPGVDDDNNGYTDDINGYDFASQKPDPTHKNNSTHGTHVAGLIAASTNNAAGISGLMARNAKIMPLNIFGTGSYASTAAIDTAIRYAADMGAKFINLSISAPGASPSTKNAMIYAVNKGVTITIAAGNDGDTLTSTNVYLPASYGAAINGAITVGATDANPSSLGSLCSFSNRSPAYVELGSPGCDTSVPSGGLLSTIDNNQYGYMEGTSMASPVALGSAAVIYSYVRDVYGKILTPAELESLMKSGSTSLSSLDSYIANGKQVDLASLKTKIIADYAPTNGTSDPGNNCP